MRLGSESAAFTHSSAHYAGGDDGALRLLVEAGLQLASERSLDALAQTAVDAGLQLCGAALGVIVYLHHGDNGETDERCRYAGIDAEQARLIAPLMPIDSLIPGEFFADEKSRARGLMHAHDLHAIPGGPSLVRFNGLPSLCSYLAAPVRHHG